MEEINSKAAGPDLLSSFFSLVQESDKLPPNHMMAMLSLYTLINILSLVKPSAPALAASNSTELNLANKLDKNNLLEMMNNLMKSQGLNQEDLIGMLGGKNTGGTGSGLGDLLGMLGKNPAALVNFLNLLNSAREAVIATKKEDPKPQEENKTIQLKEKYQ